jgi:CheY-like chemotaxis protein
VNGQIRVTSEVGRGTIFSVELAFQHAPLQDTAKPRKLRNIFLPSAGSHKNLSPSLPPLTKPPRPKSPRPAPIEIQRKTEVPIQSEESYSPRARIQQLEDDHVARARAHGYTLDRHSTEPRSPYPDMDDSEGQVSSDPLNILIADDDPTSLRTLAKRLSLRGHLVDVANDGQQAHDWFASNQSKIDVILMDLKVFVLLKQRSESNQDKC